MMPNPGTPPIISVGDVDYHFVSVVATISSGDPTYPDAYIVADPSARGAYGSEFGIPGSYWRVEKDAFHDWISPFVSGDSVLHLGMADQSSKWMWPALPLQEPSWEDADIHSGSNALSRTTPIGRGDQIDEDLPVDDGGLGCPDCPPVSDTSYYFYNLAMQYISQMDTMLLSFIHLYCPGEAGWHFGPLRTVLFPDSGGSGKIAVGPEPSPTAQPGYIVVPIVTGAGYEIGSVLIFDGPGNTYGGCAFYPYLELLAKRSDPGTEKKALKQYGLESWARWTINPAQMISDESARNIASASSFPDDYSIEYFFEWGPEPNVPFFHYAKISSLGGSPRIFDIFKVEYVRGKVGFLHKKVGYDERTIGSSPVPTQFQLSQNYPNPFNASTLIEYAIPDDGHVKLEVYNVLGQTVSTLVDEFQSAGSHAVSFDTAELPSGVYFYRLTTGLYSESRKMVLAK